MAGYSALPIAMVNPVAGAVASNIGGIATNVGQVMKG